MLILSRRIGESIIIDGTFTATVAVVGADFVDLGLCERDGTQLGCVTLNTRQRAHVVRGVSGIMIERMEQGRVRLGFDAPKRISIKRSG